jgi:hypothetical protein
MGALGTRKNGWRRGWARLESLLQLHVNPLVARASACMLDDVVCDSNPRHEQGS